MVPEQVSFVERSSLSQRVPYRRFHCISMVPQQVSFVERSSLSQRVPYQRFHCISMVPQQVSFVERSSLSQKVPYRRFHCISMVLQQVSFVERSSLSQRVPYQRFHCICLIGLSVLRKEHVFITCLWMLWFKSEPQGPFIVHVCAVHLYEYLTLMAIIGLHKNVIAPSKFMGALKCMGMMGLLYFVSR